MLEEKVEEKDRKLKLMEITIKENSEKIHQLEKMLTEKRTNKPVHIDCKECGESFSSKSYLTRHIRASHPKEYKCKICEKTFLDSWKLELHSKLHENFLPFKCNICEKEFYVNWRLKKHVQSHEQKQKFCHFYNNGKDCPYEEIGCKFKHEAANNCKFDKNCSIKLCQFKHSQSTVNLKENSEGLIDEEIKNNDNYKKYDNMNERDQFDVYQEICLTICWSGFHKCMDHDEDNELLGVNVDKIRDDYKNRREEIFHCEKCTFFSKEMEDVKQHYMKKHTKSYTCWECEKVMATMTEFKRHYGSYHFMADEIIVDSS